MPIHVTAVFPDKRAMQTSAHELSAYLTKAAGEPCRIDVIDDRTWQMHCKMPDRPGHAPKHVHNHASFIEFIKHLIAGYRGKVIRVVDSTINNDGEPACTGPALMRQPNPDPALNAFLRAKKQKDQAIAFDFDVPVKGRTITKREIANAIADELDMGQAKTLGVVRATLDKLAQALMDGKRVELRNFGVFEMRHRNGRLRSVPPKDGEATNLVEHHPDKFYVHFKPSKRIHEARAGVYPGRKSGGGRRREQREKQSQERYRERYFSYEMAQDEPKQLLISAKTPEEQAEVKKALETVKGDEKLTLQQKVGVGIIVTVYSAYMLYGVESICKMKGWKTLWQRGKDLVRGFKNKIGIKPKPYHGIPGASSLTGWITPVGSHIANPRHSHAANYKGYTGGANDYIAHTDVMKKAFDEGFGHIVQDGETLWVTCKQDALPRVRTFLRRYVNKTVTPFLNKIKISVQTEAYGKAGRIVELPVPLSFVMAHRRGSVALPPGHEGHKKRGRVIDVPKLNELCAKNDVIEKKVVDLVSRVAKTKKTGFSRDRMAKVNTESPIIIDDQDFVLDGRHRLLRADEEGRDTIKCRVATREQIQQCIKKGTNRRDASVKRHIAASYAMSNQKMRHDVYIYWRAIGPQNGWGSRKDDSDMAVVEDLMHLGKVHRHPKERGVADVSLDTPYSDAQIIEALSHWRLAGLKVNHIEASHAMDYLPDVQSQGIHGYHRSEARVIPPMQMPAKQESAVNKDTSEISLYFEGQDLADEASLWLRQNGCQVRRPFEHSHKMTVTGPRRAINMCVQKFKGSPIRGARVDQDTKMKVGSQTVDNRGTSDQITGAGASARLRRLPQQGGQMSYYFAANEPFNPGPPDVFWKTMKTWDYSTYKMAEAQKAGNKEVAEKWWTVARKAAVKANKAIGKDPKKRQYYNVAVNGGGPFKPKFNLRRNLKGALHAAKPFASAVIVYATLAAIPLALDRLINGPAKVKAKRVGKDKIVVEPGDEKQQAEVEKVAKETGGKVMKQVEASYAMSATDVMNMIFNYGDVATATAALTYLASEGFKAKRRGTTIIANMAREATDKVSGVINTMRSRYNAVVNLADKAKRVDDTLESIGSTAKKIKEFPGNVVGEAGRKVGRAAGRVGRTARTAKRLIGAAPAIAKNIYKSEGLKGFIPKTRKEAKIAATVVFATAAAAAVAYKLISKVCESVQLKGNKVIARPKDEAEQQDIEQIAKSSRGKIAAASFGVANHKRIGYEEPPQMSHHPRRGYEFMAADHLMDWEYKFLTGGEAKKALRYLGAQDMEGRLHLKGSVVTVRGLTPSESNDLFYRLKDEGIGINNEPVGKASLYRPPGRHDPFMQPQHSSPYDQHQPYGQPQYGQPPGSMFRPRNDMEPFREHGVPRDFDPSRHGDVKTGSQKPLKDELIEAVLAFGSGAVALRVIEWLSRAGIFQVGEDGHGQLYVRAKSAAFRVLQAVASAFRGKVLKTWKKPSVSTFQMPAGFHKVTPGAKAPAAPAAPKPKTPPKPKVPTKAKLPAKSGTSTLPPKGPTAKDIAMKPDRDKKPRKARKKKGEFSMALPIGAAVKKAGHWLIHDVGPHVGLMVVADLALEGIKAVTHGNGVVVQTNEPEKVEKIARKRAPRAKIQKQEQHAEMALPALIAGVGGMFGRKLIMEGAKKLGWWLLKDVSPYVATMVASDLIGSGILAEVKKGQVMVKTDDPQKAEKIAKRRDRRARAQKVSRDVAVSFGMEPFGGRRDAAADAKRAAEWVKKKVAGVKSHGPKIATVVYMTVAFAANAYLLGKFIKDVADSGSKAVTKPDGKVTVLTSDPDLIRRIAQECKATNIQVQAS